jgi:hypothetical protein
MSRREAPNIHRRHATTRTPRRGTMPRHERDHATNATPRHGTQRHATPRRVTPRNATLRHERDHATDVSQSPRHSDASSYPHVPLLALYATSGNRLKPARKHGPTPGAVRLSHRERPGQTRPGRNGAACSGLLTQVACGSRKAHVNAELPSQRVDSALITKDFHLTKDFRLIRQCTLRLSFSLTPGSALVLGVSVTTGGAGAGAVCAAPKLVRADVYRILVGQTAMNRTGS